MIYEASEHYSVIRVRHEIDDFSDWMEHCMTYGVLNLEQVVDSVVGNSSYRS